MRYWPFTMVSVLILLSLVADQAISYPTLEYYVTDDTGVLTTEDIYDIEGLCFEVDESTGAEIAVLIVETVEPDTIDMYAVGTFEESEIGQKGKDNGVLILLALDDNAWRIEIGYGLEGILPDILVNDIAQTHLVPYLDEGLVYEALYYTVASIGWEILDNYDGDQPEKDEGPWYPIPWIPLNWWQLLIAISVTVFISILTGGRLFLWIGGSFKKGGGGFGGGRSGGGGSSGKW